MYDSSSKENTLHAMKENADHVIKENDRGITAKELLCLIFSIASSFKCNVKNNYLNCKHFSRKLIKFLSKVVLMFTYNVNCVKKIKF